MDLAHRPLRRTVPVRLREFGRSTRPIQAVALAVTLLFALGTLVDGCLWAFDHPRFRGEAMGALLLAALLLMFGLAAIWKVLQIAFFSERAGGERKDWNHE